MKFKTGDILIAMDAKWPLPKTRIVREVYTDLRAYSISRPGYDPYAAGLELDQKYVEYNYRRQPRYGDLWRNLK